MALQKFLLKEIDLFLDHLLRKNLKKAETYFFQCLDKKFYDCWPLISLEKQGAFLSQSQHFIHQKALFAKDFSPLHGLYCQVIARVVLRLSTELQIVFFAEAGNFYESQHALSHALIYYARSAALSAKLQKTENTLTEKIVTLLDKCQQPYRDLQQLTAPLWQEYLDFKSLKIPRPLPQHMAQFTALTQSLIQQDAWILISELYQSDSVLNFLEQWRTNLITDWTDEGVILNSLTACENFIQLLISHRQYDHASRICLKWQKKAQQGNYEKAAAIFKKLNNKVHKAEKLALFAINNRPLASAYKNNDAWIKQQKELMALKKNFEEGVRQSHAILELQENYSQQIVRWSNQLLSELVLLLGNPPTNFCIIAGGSLGRHNFTPTSDLDIAILIADEAYRVHPYWYRLIQLWQLWLKALGGPLGVKNEKEIYSAGHVLDAGDLFYLCNENPLLIHTPEKLAHWVIKECQSSVQEKRADRTTSLVELAFGLLFTQPLYYFSGASENSSSLSELSLDQRYRQTLASYPPEMFVPTLWNNITHTVYRAVGSLSPTLALSGENLKYYYAKPLIYYTLLAVLWCRRHAKTWPETSSLSLLLKELTTAKEFHPQWIKVLVQSIQSIELSRCTQQFKEHYLADAIILFTQVQRQQLGYVYDYLVKIIYVDHSTSKINNGFFISSDPAHDYFTTYLKEYWQQVAHKQEITKSLKNGLSLWLYHLSYRGIPLKSETEYSYYDVISALHIGIEQNKTVSIKISQCIRDIFEQILAEFSAQGLKLDIMGIKNLLAHYPFCDGTRPIVTLQAQQWQAQWQALFIAHSAQSSYSASDLKARYMIKNSQGKYVRQKAVVHPAIIKKLLAEKKLLFTGKAYRFVEKAQQEKLVDGRHNVFVIENITLNDQAINLYFKIFPEMPGLEWGAGMLTRRLVGWGMPFVTLVRLKMEDSSCPVLLSQTIVGENLSKIADSAWEDFDPEYYSERIIISNVLQQEDGKGPNFIKEKPNQERARFSSVDNDRSFYPAVVQSPEFGELIPMVKDITYCVPQFLQAFHPHARANFLALAPYAVLQSWLKELSEISHQLEGLFSAEERMRYFPTQDTSKILQQRVGGWLGGGLLGEWLSPKDNLKESVLAVPLRQGLLAELYHQLQQLRASLLTYPTLTHAESLAHLQPLLVRYYLHYLKKYPTISPRKRFRLAFKKYYRVPQTKAQILAEKNPAGEITHSTTSQVLPTFYGVAVDAKKVLAPMDQTIEQALQELTTAHAIFQNFSQVQQKILHADSSALVVLKQLPALARSALINSPDFEWQKIQTSDDLTSLQYPQQILQGLIETRTPFTLLKLNDCLALNNELLRKLLSYSPQLYQLDISGCVNLQANIFNHLATLPSLQKIKANDLTQLQTLTLMQTVWSRKVWRGLTYLELQNCSNLHTLRLEAPVLTELNLDGCVALDWRKVNLTTPLLKRLSLQTTFSALAEQNDWLNCVRRLPRLQHLRLPINQNNGFTLAMAWSEQGRLADLQWLKEKNIKINQRDNKGWTVLHYAVCSYNLKLIKYLIEVLKINIHAEANEGKTPFTLFMEQVEQWGEKEQEIGEYLLLQGADINHHFGKHPRTVFVECAVREKFEQVKWLCAKGASLEEKNNNNWTVLHYAVLSKNLTIVKFLVEEVKINIDSQTDEGLTPFTFIVICNDEWEQKQQDIGEYLLSQGANINYHFGKNKHTVLMICAYLEKITKVKWLCGKGASIEEKDSKGLSVLHHAVLSKNLTTIKYLLEEAKANIHSTTDQNHTPLTLFIEKVGEWGSPEQIMGEYLLSQGADINHHFEENKQTVLMLCAKLERIEQVKWLCEKGALVEEKDSEGLSVLHYAVLSENLELIKYLVEEAKVNIHAKTNEGHTPFTIFMERVEQWEKEEQEIGEYLLSQGFDINHCFGEVKQTLLINCACFGEIAKVKWLCVKGALVEEKDSHGGSALHHAVFSKNLVVIKYLVEEIKANIDVEMNGGYTPLFLLIATGEEWGEKEQEIGEYLLSQGANINHAASKNKMTALMHVSLAGKIEKVKWLCEKNACLELKNDDDCTALYAAIYARDLVTIKYLLEEAKVNLHAENDVGHTPFTFWLHTIDQWEEEEQKIGEYLLSQGVNINHAVGENKITALMYVSLDGEIEKVKWLCAKGALVEEKDSEGKTALHYALFSKNLEVIKYLVEKAKVNLHAENDAGHTPFTFWLHTIDQWEEEEQKIGEYLLSQGVNINHVTSEENMTALMYVSLAGEIKKVKWLYKYGASLDIKSFEGLSVLYYAMKSENLSVILYLMEIVPLTVYAISHIEYFFLKYFVAYNRMSCPELTVKDFFKDKTDFNSKNLVMKMTLLMLCAVGTKKKAVKGLIDQGARVEEKDLIGNRAIHYAAGGGSLKIVKYLISQGAEVGVSNDHGLFPSEIAANAGHAEVAQYLLNCEYQQQIKYQAQQMVYFNWQEVIEAQDPQQVHSLNLEQWDLSALSSTQWQVIKNWLQEKKVIIMSLNATVPAPHRKELEAIIENNIRHKQLQPEIPSLKYTVARCFFKNFGGFLFYQSKPALAKTWQARGGKLKHLEIITAEMEEIIQAQSAVGVKYI